MIAFKINLDSIDPLAWIDKVFDQVFVNDNDNFTAQKCLLLQVSIEVEQVEDVEMLVLIDIKDIEAEVMLLLLIVSPERQQAFNKVIERYFRSHILGHMEKKHFAKERLIYSNHILNVFHEIFFH